MSNKTKKEELKVRLLEYQRKVAETEIEILKEEYMDVMTNNHTIMGLKKFMCCNTNVTPVTCSTVKLQDGAPTPIDNEKLPAMVYFSLYPFKSVDPVYLLDGTVTLSLRSTGEHPDLLKRGHLDVTAMKDMDDLRIALPGSQVDTPWYLLEFDTSAVKDDFVHLVQGVGDNSGFFTTPCEVCGNQQPLFSWKVVLPSSSLLYGLAAKEGDNPYKVHLCAVCYEVADFVKGKDADKLYHGIDVKLLPAECNWTLGDHRM